MVASSDTPLSSAAAAALEQVVKQVDKVPDVKSVRLAGVSKDGEAAQLLVRAAASQSDINKDKDLIDNIGGFRSSLFLAEIRDFNYADSGPIPEKS